MSSLPQCVFTQQEERCQQPGGYGSTVRGRGDKQVFGQAAAVLVTLPARFAAEFHTIEFAAALLGKGLAVAGSTSPLHQEIGAAVLVVVVSRHVVRVVVDGAVEVLESVLVLLRHHCRCQRSGLGAHELGRGQARRRRGQAAHDDGGCRRCCRRRPGRGCRLWVTRAAPTANSATAAAAADWQRHDAVAAFLLERRRDGRHVGRRARHALPPRHAAVPRRCSDQDRMRVRPRVRVRVRRRRRLPAAEYRYRGRRRADGRGQDRGRRRARAATADVPRSVRRRRHGQAMD